MNNKEKKKEEEEKGQLAALIIIPNSLLSFPHNKPEERRLGGFGNAG
jgi:hypothetical protein